MLHFRKVCFSLVLSIISAVSLGTAWSLPLQNGDFSSGFASWQGQLLENNMTITDVPSPSAPQYTVANQVAQLQTDDTYWQVTLFQEFDMEPLPGNGFVRYLSMWLQWLPSDENSDFLSVPLASNDLLAGATAADLLQGKTITYDVTGFANQFVSLDFTLVDIDFGPDALQIADISFMTEGPLTPVPEPATVILLGMGLIGTIAFRRLL